MSFDKVLTDFVASKDFSSEIKHKLLHDKKKFKDLSAYEKVRLINYICDYRLTTNEATEKTLVCQVTKVSPNCELLS